MEPFLFEKKHSKKMSKNLKISQNFSNVVFQTWFCETGFCIAYLFWTIENLKRTQKNQKITKNLKKNEKSQKNLSNFLEKNKKTRNN